MKRSIFYLGAFFFIFLFSGCEPADVPIDYSYEVSGTSGSYSVTIQNVDDNTQQFSTVGNGWNYKWTQTGGTRWLYISAQNNLSTGNVTVKIIRAGAVVSQNTGYGGYTIATVSGDF